MTSPKAHVRAKAVATASEWQVISVTAAPTYLDPSGAGGLPAGGTTGQVLTKFSDADGAADWEAGGGSQTFTQIRIPISAAQIRAATTEIEIL